MTCVIGLLFFFAIPDFAEEVSWLSPEERQFVKARLQEDVGESQRNKHLKPKEIFSILSECRMHRRSSEAFVFLTVLFLGKTILGGFMYFGLIVPAYGYGQCWHPCSWTRVLTIACFSQQHTSRLPSSSLWAMMLSELNFCPSLHGHVLLASPCLSLLCLTVLDIATSSHSSLKRSHSLVSEYCSMFTTTRIFNMQPCS